MKNKVSLFIDKSDIVKLYTDDNIINITGMIGSGKTTTASQYKNNNNYIVISLDCLYRGQDKENMNENTMEINKILKEKFSEQDNETYFKNYYHEILKYIDTFDKSITFVLEGQHIYRYLDLQEIKGKLIIKRTCIMKCWKRSILRHIKRKKMELDNNVITKKQYYSNIYYWMKRRTKQLKYYKDLNRFLNKIEENSTLKNERYKKNVQ